MVTNPEVDRQLDIGYDDFAEHPFYRRVNASLLRLSPRVKSVVDLATGTGAAAKILFELERIIPGSESSVYGFDVDKNGLKIARKKMYEVNTIGARTYFRPGDFHHVELRSRSQQLASLLNGPHMSDNPPLLYSEIHRVLVDEGLEASIDEMLPRDAFLSNFFEPNEEVVPFPGFQLEESFFNSDSGVAFLNTAYVKNKSYPPGTEVVWRDIVIGARQKLRGDKELAITKFKHPVDRFTYTEDQLLQTAVDAGFSFVQPFEYTADMDLVAMQAICKYGEFATGALPGIPPKKAAQALFDSVPEVYEKYQIKSVPRTWLLIVLRK